MKRIEVSCLFVFLCVWLKDLLFQENSFLRDELVTFSRFSLPKTFVIDETKKLLDVIVSATLPIEDSKGKKRENSCCPVFLTYISLFFLAAPLHADFANKFPGGGALDGGCVQEEILFVIKPVLISASVLVCLSNRNRNV